ncbi:YfbU family protein [Rhizobium leguminosarum]|nr:YfbU family protein [Rhizobium leguminosarum]
MVTLSFTPEQRFIIALICDLYKEPAKRELNPDLIMNAVYGGHDWALTWEYNGVFPSEIDTPENVSFVVDTLDMWNFIESGYAKLGAEDKEKVKGEVAYLGDEGPKFPGFDGNNESEYMSIAWMLTEKLGRFVSLKNRGSLNSHMPVVSRYREMLVPWRDIRPTLGMGEMTAEQIIQLLTRR